ncbi:MAG TPA: hypothetical protein VGR08_00290 [Thermomicrobiales bacterium]|nr:hypothetical protein [Thermomicrobiales bacterium]
MTGALRPLGVAMAGDGWLGLGSDQGDRLAIVTGPCGAPLGSLWNPGPIASTPGRWRADAGRDVRAGWERSAG